MSTIENAAASSNFILWITPLSLGPMILMSSSTVLTTGPRNSSFVMKMLWSAWMRVRPSFSVARYLMLARLIALFSVGLKLWRADGPSRRKETILPYHSTAGKLGGLVQGWGGPLTELKSIGNRAWKRLTVNTILSRSTAIACWLLFGGKARHAICYSHDFCLAFIYVKRETERETRDTREKVCGGGGYQFIPYYYKKDFI